MVRHIDVRMKHGPESEAPNAGCPTGPNHLYCECIFLRMHWWANVQNSFHAFKRLLHHVPREHVTYDNISDALRAQVVGGVHAAYKRAYSRASFHQMRKASAGCLT